MKLSLFIILLLSYLLPYSDQDVSSNEELRSLEGNACATNTSNCGSSLVKCVKATIDQGISRHFLNQSQCQIKLEECVAEKKIQSERLISAFQKSILAIENIRRDTQALVNATLTKEDGNYGENRRPIICPDNVNSSHLCSGFTCLVNNADECRQIMRNHSCGVAFYVSMKKEMDQFQCKMIFPRHSSVPIESDIHFKANVDEILYFKIYSGAQGDIEPADALLSGPSSSEIRFPLTKSSSFSTGSYYRSPLWNIRDEIGATTITVSMHGNLEEDGDDKCELTFSNSIGLNGEWFNKDNLHSSYPVLVDQLKTNEYHQFSIRGIHVHPYAKRQFYAMRHIGCPGDFGPMAVIIKDDSCQWANSSLPLPRLICATAWKPDTSVTLNEPNMRSRGRFMNELEVTGRLSRRVNVLYSGYKDV